MGKSLKTPQVQKVNLLNLELFRRSMERVTKNIIARDKKLTGNFKDFNEAMTEIYLLEKGLRDENKV